MSKSALIFLLPGLLSLSVVASENPGVLTGDAGRGDLFAHARVLKSEPLFSEPLLTSRSNWRLVRKGNRVWYYSATIPHAGGRTKSLNVPSGYCIQWNALPKVRKANIFRSGIVSVSSLEEADAFSGVKTPLVFEALTPRTEIYLVMYGDGGRSQKCRTRSRHLTHKSIIKALRTKRRPVEPAPSKTNRNRIHQGNTSSLKRLNQQREMERKIEEKRLRLQPGADR